MNKYEKAVTHFANDFVQTNQGVKPLINFGLQLKVNNKELEEDIKIMQELEFNIRYNKLFILNMNDIGKMLEYYYNDVTSGNSTLDLILNNFVEKIKQDYELEIQHKKNAELINENKMEQIVKDYIIKLLEYQETKIKAINLGWILEKDKLLQVELELIKMAKNYIKKGTINNDKNNSRSKRK